MRSNQISKRNGLPKEIRLAATLAKETNPTAPVIMGGDPVIGIGRAASLGYDAVELHWPSPSDIPMERVLAACKLHDMEISAFATGRSYTQQGLSLIAPEPEIRTAAINRLLEFVDAAAPHHATVILGCIRGNLFGPSQREEALERLSQGTRTIAHYAMEKGVRIVFEAINRYENNYLNNAAETVQFIRDYGLPNTKILLDTFHMNIEDANFAQAIVDCGELLGYVHIADSNRLFAGAGHLPLKEVADALKQIGYQGVLSAECLPLPDSDTALAGWIKGVKQAFI